VGGVTSAPAAKFLELQAVRIVLLVLNSRVVAPLALVALEGDDRFHGPSGFFSTPAGTAFLEGAVGLEAKRNKPRIP
jgi:hypothetical protein